MFVTETTHPDVIVMLTFMLAVLVFAAAEEANATEAAASAAAPISLRM